MMAYNEFLELEVLCETTRSLNQDGSKDSWFYIWNSDEFSWKNAYKALIGWQPSLHTFPGSGVPHARPSTSSSFGSFYLIG
jgi:hypothetical protein